LDRGGAVAESVAEERALDLAGLRRQELPVLLRHDQVPLRLRIHVYAQRRVAGREPLERSCPLLHGRDQLREVGYGRLEALGPLVQLDLLQRFLDLAHSLTPPWPTVV